MHRLYRDVAMRPRGYVLRVSACPDPWRWVLFITDSNGLVVQTLSNLRLEWDDLELLCQGQTIERILPDGSMILLVRRGKRLHFRQAPSGFYGWISWRVLASAACALEVGRSNRNPT